MTNVKELPMLDFGTALNQAWQKVTKFEGRSRRSEFWWTYLAAYLANFVCNFIPFLGGLISLVVMLAIIPITFRRLHDTGRSGWWYGIGLILGCLGMVAIAMVFIGEFSGGISVLEQAEPEEIFRMFGNVIGNPVVILSCLAGIVYNIILLVFFCQDSQKEANKYGESPKYVVEEAV